MKVKENAYVFSFFLKIIYRCLSKSLHCWSITNFDVSSAECVRAKKVKKYKILGRETVHILYSINFSTMAMQISTFRNILRFGNRVQNVSKIPV